MDGFQASFANRKARNPDQGFAANAAIGRKQRGKKALGKDRCPLNNRGPDGAGLSGPSSVPATAEDVLPSSSGYVPSPAQTILLQYSGLRRAHAMCWFFSDGGCVSFWVSPRSSDRAGQKP